MGTAGDTYLKTAASGLGRGMAAAMAMTGMRQVTTGLGLVDQTPPEAILQQSAPTLLVRLPTVAYFVARRQRVAIELAHWFYGALGGVAFGSLPEAFLRRPWAGPAYGLLTWLAFEASLAPILGLEQARKVRIAERAAFAGDHLLYGVLLAGDRRWALARSGRRYRR